METEKIWKRCANNNLVLSEDEFYISYNPMTFDGHEETALFSEKDNEWRILNGDHRTAYEDAVVKGGFEACRDYYIENKKKFGSGWSTDEDGFADITI